MGNLKDCLPNSGQPLMSIRFNTLSFTLSSNSNAEYYVNDLGNINL